MTTHSIAIMFLIFIFIVICVGFIVLLIMHIRQFNKNIEEIDDIMKEISSDNQD